MSTPRPTTQSLTFIFLVTIFWACSQKAAEQTNRQATATVTETSGTQAPDMSHRYVWYDSVSYDELRRALPPFDLNQDLSGRSIEELRILRNTIPARYGYLFMEADLRYYFYNTPWYERLMAARWYGDCEDSGLKPAPPIEYTAEETAFIERVKELEIARGRENYIVRNGLRYANVKNIVNQWQFGKLPQPLLDALDRNGFAIVPNQNVQLFHLYEQNDYSQTQNFVSTDLYLQLFHMHYSFMLRGLEERKFIPALGQLMYGITSEALALGRKTSDPAEKNALDYTASFYGIPLILLGAEGVTIPDAFTDAVNREIALIDGQTADLSPLLPAYRAYEFQYDMFKPRGHYTRLDTLGRYFKAMQWLQLAPYCLEDETDLRRALAAAYVLSSGTSLDGRPLLSLYKAILEPTTFLVGKPDNLSIIDICELISARDINSLTELLSEANVSAIRNEMKMAAATKNIIKPKVEKTCPEKINFMPSRFVLDNEILQEMTDLTKRPYPQGLDVLAAFGSQVAENVLVNELKEDKKWDKFLPTLRDLKAKYRNYEQWDQTVYAKWISSLQALVKPDKQYPSFMQLPAWNKKNLNTALASWAELKHDAVLYTEQPMAAECGDGGDCEPPPDPYVVGYVEPNVAYWKSALELLDVTETLLSEHGMLDNAIASEQAQLRDLCKFLLGVSEKELRGQKLTEQEYKTIELIGTTAESITLDIIGVYDWSYISGPDKEIAVVADVYTNNAGNNAGILHAAVGYGNDLYVVVEIGGYLYLTKGSTFSYYEFPRPLDQRMTDEEWQKMLKDGERYPVPSWIQEVILELDKSMQPQTREYVYSSGC